MAGIASTIGDDVYCRLAGSDNSVMAARTATLYFFMVNTSRRRPSLGRMTDFA